MEKYQLYYGRIEHGQTLTFSMTLNQKGRVGSLEPPSATTTECLGTLAGLCACYGKTSVSWNVVPNQRIDKVPFTIQCTIKFEASLGEYWGNRKGEPAPEMGIWISVAFSFAADIPPPPPQQFTLTITKDSGGATEPAAGVYSHISGVGVKVTAIPYLNYIFSHWVLNGQVFTANPLTLIMQADAILEPKFTSVAPPSPDMGTMIVRCFLNNIEVVANVEIVNVGIYQTPFSIQLSPGTYVVKALYQGVEQERSITIGAGQTIKENFVFRGDKGFNLLPLLIIGGVVIISGGKL